MSMFCYQCEQTAKGTGCTVQGVCGKDETTATLQDLLVHAVKGIAMYAKRARELGKTDREINVFTLEALFSTITNVDFDPERLQKILIKAAAMRDKARQLYEAGCQQKDKKPENLTGPAIWIPADSIDGLVKQGREFSIPKRHEKFGDDLAGLMDLILFGLKGAAAYADHAQILGKESDEVYARFHETLDFLTHDSFTADELVAMAIKTGELNLKAMELLDSANTTAYGNPVPTKVRITPIKGKAIAVSGHDLKDLEELLKQTQGKGINIYTHGEMLPAHGYPKLKQYKHLVGNYGNAWQNQQKEFPEFPGAILMTTNCIQRPSESYKARIFTTGLVAFPGVKHVTNKDFSSVIKAAQDAKGFTEDAPEKYTTVGFGHNTVIGIANKIVDAVKAGKIKHFFLVGGCDGAKPGRNYYTEFAQAVPKDSIILTLACGKYRFNKLDFGDIDGIPRLLDIGQCNDAYSAIQIALALSKAFGKEINDLPLSLILSWYEQKAVAILLTLLFLGIKNIRIGPSLPAFVSPSVLKVLVDKFNLKLITTPEQDLKAILS
jgi:hydroxylamine reductase